LEWAVGVKNIYERFIWLDDRVRAKKYPNATTLAEKFEISTKTAQRDIEFMKYRLQCPMKYDARRKGYYYEDDTFSLPMITLMRAHLGEYEHLEAKMKQAAHNQKTLRGT
jgi:predicted DNA-binding transcriptional regulator YafY